MKTEILHACGHTATADITGPDTRGQRARTAAWLAEKDCPDCSRRRRAQQREEDNAQAAAASAAQGWPDITGTPRQTAWATTIRADAIAAMRDRLAAKCTTESAEELHRRWTAAALRQTDAAWWIEHRASILPSINSLTLTSEERDTMEKAAKEWARR
ncbi:hypothetical protein [Streptomyces noursei]|uniref:hypothetical protein n=1 Tax=Streptomyces noursei TaxID=1971 RepID=UPI0023B7DC56|nr:hypothetical protein [Streptomyces noursei]